MGIIKNNLKMQSKQGNERTLLYMSSATGTFLFWNACACVTLIKKEQLNKTITFQILFLILLLSADDDDDDNDQVVDDDAGLESEQMWDGINCILGSAHHDPPPPKYASLHVIPALNYIH